MHQDMQINMHWQTKQLGGEASELCLSCYTLVEFYLRGEKIIPEIVFYLAELKMLWIQWFKMKVMIFFLESMVQL